MMLGKLAIYALLFAVTTGIVACGKEERKPETASPEEPKDLAVAAEAEKRSAVMTELLTEQQFLDLKIKAAAERLGKQGNKTRKKLNPKFAALDGAMLEVSTSLEQLQTLPNPGFIEESNALRARQDSLSRTLSALEKSMK
jgi:hypothetical protein